MDNFGCRLASTAGSQLYDSQADHQARLTLQKRAIRDGNATGGGRLLDCLLMMTRGLDKWDCETHQAEALSQPGATLWRKIAGMTATVGLGNSRATQQACSGYNSPHCRGTAIDCRQPHWREKRSQHRLATGGAKAVIADKILHSPKNSPKQHAIFQDSQPTGYCRRRLMMMLLYRPLAAVIGSTGTRSTAKGAARKYACILSFMMSANSPRQTRAQTLLPKLRAVQAS